MIIVLKPSAPAEAVDELLGLIASKGLQPLHMPGSERVVLGALGDERALAELNLESRDWVESVKPILSPYKMVSREVHSESTVVTIGGHEIGDGVLRLIAGPCSVETKESLTASAQTVKDAGVTILRAGAFKPRTSPYDFQGQGLEGLKLLAEVARELGLATVTEVMEPGEVDAVADHADALQVGTRNMQNYPLLRALGRLQKPVLLKRGMSARLEELLLAAEYIVSAGNPNVILCERGIRTFETAMRNTLDLNAVPFLKAKSHLPVMVDPSHGTGSRDLVAPMALAAAACGADGLLIEVHHDPAHAWSDGAQTLYPDQFNTLVGHLRGVCGALGRDVA